MNVQYKFVLQIEEMQMIVQYSNVFTYVARGIQIWGTKLCTEDCTRCFEQQLYFNNTISITYNSLYLFNVPWL